MSQQRSILTQDDIVALNEQLSVIGANLNAHVNASLSAAHGINAQGGANYQDTAGDQWGSIVLKFEFGTPPNVTTLYVPAQVTSLGPARTNNGLQLSATSPTGTFLSPGVPINEHPLITDFAEVILQNAQIYNDILLAHANGVASDTGSSQVHGGTTFTVGNTLDTLGHKVGRYIISMGIDGTNWSIPADTSPNGPPQPPRNLVITQSPVKANTSYPSGFQLSAGYYRSFATLSANDDFDTHGYPSGRLWTPTVQGTPPFTYKWFFLPQKFGNPSGIPDPNNPAWVQVTATSPTPISITGTAFVVGSACNWKGPHAIGDESYNFNFWWKLEVSNAGGLATALIEVNCQKVDDDDDCWFLTASERNFTEDELKLIDSIHKTAGRLAPLCTAAYIRHGWRLVDKIRKAGQGREYFEKFTSDVFALAKTDLNAAGKYFIDFVAKAVMEYWPDTDCRIFKRTIQKLQQENPGLKHPSASDVAL